MTHVLHKINDRHTCQVCTKSRVCALKPRYANKCNCDANVLKLEPPSLSKCRCSGDQGSRPPLTRGSLASSATVKIVQIKKHAVGELDLRRLLCSVLQVGAAARLDPSQLARGLLLASSAYSSAAGSACYFSALRCTRKRGHGASLRCWVLTQDPGFLTYRGNVSLAWPHPATCQRAPDIKRALDSRGTNFIWLLLTSAAACMITFPCSDKRIRLHNASMATTMMTTMEVGNDKW